MKIPTLMASALLVLMAGSVAMAADVTGKWTGEMQGGGGQTRPVTFNFKADGDKLTGNTVGGQGRENAIADGKITGDDISFNVTVERQGNQMKMTYAGKVSGDEIKMKQTREGGDRTVEFTVKRAK